MGDIEGPKIPTVILQFEFLLFRRKRLLLPLKLTPNLLQRNMLPLTAINQKKEVEFHLSRYCQIVANMFGKAEDFLEVLGLDDPMADQITELATQFALMKYNKRFIQPWKVLCDTLKEGFRHYLDNQRAQLDLLEK